MSSGSPSARASQGCKNEARGRGLNAVVSRKTSICAFQYGHPSKLTKKLIENVSNFEPSIYFPDNWSTQNDLEFSNFVFSHNPLLQSKKRCQKRKKPKALASLKNSEYCEINSNSDAGTLVAVVIGNSFTGHIIPILRENPKFKKIIVISAVACRFPDSVGGRCRGLTESVYSEIPKIKPDIIFVFQAYGKKLRSPSVTQVDHEFILLNETYQFLQKHSSAVISPKEQFYFSAQILTEFTRRKFYGHGIDLTKRKTVCVFGGRDNSAKNKLADTIPRTEAAIGSFTLSKMFLDRLSRCFLQPAFL